MSNDTDVREFLRQMADEIDVPPPDWRSPVKRARRYRSLAVAVVVVIVVAIVSAGSVGLHSLTETRLRPANGPLPNTHPTGGPGTMVDIRTGEVTPLPASIASSGAAYYTVSPDHTQIAYSTCCAFPDPLFVANLDGTGIRRVTRAGQDAYGAQWSPDGSLLVYQQRDGSTEYLGNLFVQNVATSQRTRVTNLDQTQEWGWWFTFPSFAPDGRSILFQLPRGHLPNNDNRIWDLWSVPVAGGKPTLVRRNAGWGGYSPDGKWLAYFSPVRRDFTGAGLWITSVHGGTPRALVRDGSLGEPRWSPDGTRISYSNDDVGWIYALNVATGSTTKVASAGTAEWFDDHTLIIGPGG